MPRVWVMGQGTPPGGWTLGKRFGKDACQRHDDEQAHDADGRGDEQAFGERVGGGDGGLGHGDRVAPSH